MTDPLSKEQLQQYYQVQLPEQLRDILQLTNGLIGQDETYRIIDEYASLIGDVNRPALFEKYRDDRRAAEVPPQETWFTELPNQQVIPVEHFLAMAMLGMGLIHHVDQNSRMTPDTSSEGLTTISDSRRLENVLQADRMPQLSIHGSAMYWLGEFIQVISRTYEKIGLTDKAQEILRIALADFVQKESAGEPLTNGEKSAKAVVQYRLGELLKDLKIRLSGLITERQNSEEEFNRERLVTLAFGTFFSAVNPAYKTTSEVRWEAAKESASALGYSLKKDFFGTVKSSGKEIAKQVKKVF